MKLNLCVEECRIHNYKNRMIKSKQTNIENTENKLNKFKYGNKN